jgi:polyisoprenyl-phosphate glycosyltransferase
MISIIIPSYNEEECIQVTINKCKDLLLKVGNEYSEIIVVDDGSTDNTYQKSLESGIKAIRHPHNIGYGKALKNGILIAKNEIIIITDADGTYPIERIPDLITMYQKGYNMIVGARTGKHYDESFFKKSNRRLLKFLVEFTAGRKIDDINSGLRIFSKSEILPYIDTLCDTFSFTTSLSLAYMMTGKFVGYMPIEYHSRIGKSKVRLFRDSLRTFQFITEAILFYNPIKIFLLFSIILIIIGSLNLVLAYFTYLKIAYVLGISSILLAILMLAIGFLSVQLKQILTRNNK